MADNKIRFTIDSVFSGEGFKRANDSVRQTSDVIKKSSQAVSGLSSAFGSLPGKIAPAADAAGKLFSAFSAGAVGVSLAITTYVIGAIHKWYDEQRTLRMQLNDEYDKLESRWSRVYENVARIAREKTEEALKASIERSQKAIDKIEKLTASYHKLYDAVTSVAKAEANLKNTMVDINLATNANLGGADAQKAREIQARIEKAENDYAAALELAKHNYAKANDAVGVLKTKYEELKKVYDDTVKLGEDANKARLAMNQAEVELAAAEKALKAAEIAKEQAVLDHELAITKLSNEEEKLRVEIQKREDAEAMKRKVEEDATRQIDELTEKTKKEIDAIDRKIKAQDDYIDAIKAAKDTVASGMQGSQNHEGGAMGPYQYSKDANGNIDDFEDFQHAQNFAEWNERDQASKSAHDNYLAKKANALKAAQKKGKKLSKGDQKFLDDWDAYNDQKKNLAEEEKKRKDLEEERRTALTNLDKNVQEIKDSIDKALEVQ